MCGSRTLRLRGRRERVASASTWESESTMRLLGLDDQVVEVRLCSRCLHAFRFPLYDEERIYGERGFEYRKQAYEKHRPGQTYGQRASGLKPAAWARRCRGILEFLAAALKHVESERGQGTRESLESLSVLDYGGGDGYVVESLALVSRKVLGIDCRAYCLDYHEWDKASPSPYFSYVSVQAAAEKGPYDLVILSHVLEHVAFPDLVLRRVRDLLSEDGLVVVVVPYEQFALVSASSSAMHYHQQMFSTRSVRTLLSKCGLRPGDVAMRRLSYRGQLMWQVSAVAGRDGEPDRARYGDYPRDLAALALLGFLRIVIPGLRAKARKEWRRVRGGRGA